VEVGMVWHIPCNLFGWMKKMASEQKRILIIDPDRKERQNLTSFLRGENYFVECGKGIPDAIKMLSEGYFHCLVLDVDLPEMKGYEAISILRGIDPDIKVIMTTKKNTKRLEAKVRERDVFYYFIKSFGKDELKLAINNALIK
jgi:DNA-binding NtrC family response regulator